MATEAVPARGRRWYYTCFLVPTWCNPAAKPSGSLPRSFVMKWLAGAFTCSLVGSRCRSNFQCMWSVASDWYLQPHKAKIMLTKSGCLGNNMEQLQYDDLAVHWQISYQHMDFFAVQNICQAIPVDNGQSQTWPSKAYSTPSRRCKGTWNFRPAQSLVSALESRHRCGSKTVRFFFSDAYPDCFTWRAWLARTRTDIYWCHNVCPVCPWWNEIPAVRGMMSPYRPKTSSLFIDAHRMFSFTVQTAQRKKPTAVKTFMLSFSELAAMRPIFFSSISTSKKHFLSDLKLELLEWNLMGISRRRNTLYNFPYCEISRWLCNTFLQPSYSCIM